MEPGKQYVIFLWKPVKSSEAYMTARAFLIEHGRVYSIDRDQHEEINGTSVDAFIQK
jgi:hypothetical protein